MTEKKVNWWSKHVDTLAILTSIFTAIFWMNAKFNGIDKDFAKVNQQLMKIETILILKGIMPCELAVKTDEGK